MAFQDQVEDLTSLSVSDTGELSQFLKDGVIDVTNKWVAVRPQDIDLFIRVSGEQTANDSLALNGVKIINVIREDGTNNQWRNCTKIPPSLQYDVTDEDSLNYASKINPVYTLLHNGKVNVFPSAAVGGANSFKVYYVNNEPTDLTNNAALIHSHSDIQYFPADKVYLVIMYAGIRLLNATMGSSVISLTSVPPDVPSLATISFSETNALDITVDNDPTAITLVSVDYNAVSETASTVLSSLTAPTYTKPGHPAQVAFADYWTVGDFGDSDPGVLTVTAVTPVVPTISSQVIADPSSFAPTYTKPVLSLGAAPTISDLSITTAVPVAPVISSQTIADPSSFAPAYTKPVLTLGTAPTISNLTISAVSPVTPSLTSVTFTSIDSALDAFAPVYTTATVNAASTYTGSTPTYTKPTLVLGAAPTISNLSITAVPPDTPSAPVFTTPSVSLQTAGSLGTAPTYTIASQTFDIGQLNTFIVTDEDSELAQVQLGRLQHELGEYQADIQNNLNEFNEDNVIYQSTVQKALQELQVAAAKAQKDADFIQQTQIQEYASKIQKYQAELGVYQAEVGAQIQEYQQNLTGDIQVWQGERTTDLQKYGSDIQNELNEFNKENVAYQSAIQESVQELQVANGVNLAQAQADLQLATTNKERDQQRQLQNGVNDMQAIVQDNARKLTLYQAEVGTYQAEIGKEVQEYQQNLAGDIQVWQAERQTDLQKYGTDVQNELNEFNKENAKYQAIVQEYIQEAQLLDAHEARKLQKYQAEVGTYSADVNKQVQEYQQNLQGDLQVWQTERQTDLQQYGSDLQNELNEFNKENAKYQAILQEYIQEAQLLDAHEARKIQKYSAEVQTYQSDVGKQVQEYTQKLSRYQLELSTVNQAWAKTESDNLQVFQLDIQNELNEFNKENAAFGYEVQKALADAQATNQIAMQNGIQEARDAIENNNAQVQRFQSMAQHYATQVNEDIQAYTSRLQTDIQTMQAIIADNQALLTKYQAEIAEYQAEVAAETQEQSIKIQQYQLLYNQLKAEYDQAFMIAAPQQQAAQGTA